MAAEVFGGVYGHGLAEHPGEGGADLMAGARTDPMQSWTWLAKPSAYVLASANTAVPTDFIAVGLSWLVPFGHGGRFYARPGFGVAYTTGEANVGNSADLNVSPAEHQRRLNLAQTRIDFGSNALFEPEFALGYRLSRRWAAEISYVHLSNGQIFHHGKNQGLDDAGVRMAYTF